MAKVPLKYLFYTLDVFIILLAGYLIYTSNFSFDIIKWAVIVLTLLCLYKYMGEFLDLPPNRTWKQVSLGDPKNSRSGEFPRKQSKNKSNIITRYIFRFIIYIYNRPEYRILIDIIFIVPFLNPFMWHHLLIWWIWNRWYYVKVFINGNKDIFFKRYFGIDSTKWLIRDSNDLQLTIFSRIINFLFFYPFFRMILFPSYVKEKILHKEWVDFFKARFLASIYVLVYLSYEFYDILYSMPLYSKMLIVYVFFALIWPGFAHIGSKIYMFDYLLVLWPYPFVIYKFINIKGLTFGFLYLYSSLINGYFDYYILRKYGFLSSYNYSFYKKSEILIGKTASSDEDDGSVYYIFNDRVFKLYDFWLYEKNYTIPAGLYFQFRTLVWNCINLKILYMEGTKFYGTNYMNVKYSRHYERHKDFFKCAFFVLMDCRRIFGFNKDELIFKLGNHPYYSNFSFEELVNYYYSTLLWKLDYNNLQIDKFVSNKRYVELFESMLFIESFGGIVFYEFNLLERNLVKEAKIKEKPIGSFLIGEEETFVNEVSAFIDAIEKEYLDCFSKLNDNDTNTLISVKIVNEFKNKWGKEFLRSSIVYDVDKENPYDPSSY